MEKTKIQIHSDEFHKIWDKKKLWQEVSWLGIGMWKLPFDAFIIQELLFKVQPDFVIETGTNFGGSSLFYASILKLIGKGRVITIDIKDKASGIDEIKSRLDLSITRVIGDSVSNETYKQMLSIAGANKTFFVILDSWHTKEHVLKELRIYSHLIHMGSYIIVEDTHVSGHPIKWKWGDGPYEAVHEFLQENSTFAVDKRCEKLAMTFNPCGFLRKVLHGGRHNGDS